MAEVKEFNSEKIIEKIKKILALSSNNPSAEEAQSAALKAQALLAEYGMSMEDLNVNEKEFTPALEDVYTGVDKSFKYELADIIAKNFRCKTFITNRRVMHFFGHETDTKVAAEVFKYLFKVCDRGARREGDKAEKMLGTRKGVYYSYTRGFCQGVSDALDKQCKALMIVTPKEVTESWDDYHIKVGMGTLGGLRDGSEHGLNRSQYNQGVADGKSAMQEKQTKQIAQ